MENTITKNCILEKTAVFSKDMKKRYELTFTCKGVGKKEKGILVICLNPASKDILMSDTTTNYILNNLLPMGFTTITVCNLFANICTKLKTTALGDTKDNLDYIGEILGSKYHTILIGYGNTFESNKRVNEEKQNLLELLKAGKGNIVELVDTDNVYSRLKTIHPLFAGQRFSGKWKFRKYVFEKEEKVQEGESKNVSENSK